MQLVLCAARSVANIHKNPVQRAMVCCSRTLHMLSWVDEQVKRSTQGWGAPAAAERICSRARATNAHMCWEALCTHGTQQTNLTARLPPPATDQPVGNGGSASKDTHVSGTVKVRLLV
jgi:hypothetical protein